MAISPTVLSNPQITIDAVDYTDHCTSATVNVVYEQLENTTFSNTSRSYTAGLGSHEITATMMLAYGAGELEDDLAALVGTTFNVVVTSAAGTVGAGNPSHTLTGCYLSEITPVNASLGELQTIELTFAGGVYTRATS